VTRLTNPDPLDRALMELEESAPAAPPPGLPAAAASRNRVAAVAIVGVLVIFAVVVGVTFPGWLDILRRLGLPPSPTPSPSVPSESPSASAMPGVIGEEWQLVELEPDSPGYLVVLGGWAGPQGVVLTGVIDGPAAEAFDHSQPMAWHSPDGTSWQRSTIELSSASEVDPYQLGPVYYDHVGDVLYAFGLGALRSSAGFGSALFRSDDWGTTWRQLDEEGSSVVGNVRDVAIGAPGWAAVGDSALPGAPEATGAMVWTSRDAVHWEPIPDRGLGPGMLAYGHLAAVAGWEGQLVAVGFTLPEMHAAGAGSIWTSRDGLAWELRDMPAPAHEILDVTPYGGGFLAIGAVSNPEGMPSPAAWRAGEDGSVWMSLSMEADGASRAVSVTGTNAGTVVAAGDGIDQAVAWLLRGGSETWSLSSLPLPEGEGAGARIALPLGDGVLVAGVTNDSRRPVVWISPPPNAEPAMAQPCGTPGPYIADELMVKFTEPPSAEQLQGFAERHRLQHTGQALDWHRFQIIDGTDAAVKAEILAADEDVAAVNLSYLGEWGATGPSPSDGPCS
jgi:hypothetical protein